MEAVKDRLKLELADLFDATLVEVGDGPQLVRR
jgi:hypothetical protein